VIAFAELGYDILCEKPLATSATECRAMAEAVEKANIIFGIGHVLRYSPYNMEIKRILDSGALGKIVNIVHVEPIGNVHFSHSYVRGNWHKEKDTSFSLLTKSCQSVVRFDMSTLVPGCILTKLVHLVISTLSRPYSRHPSYQCGAFHLTLVRQALLW
jgi:hypothetical protein